MLGHHEEKTITELEKQQARTANKQTNPAGRSQLLRYQWGNPDSQLATRVTD